MKKILATMIGLVAGAAFVHAQGYIEFYGSAANIQTNTSISTFVGGTETGGTGGKTYASSVAANAYDYALLVWIGSGSATGGIDVTNSSDWTLVTLDGGGTELGHNYAVAGTLDDANGVAGVQINLAASTAYSVLLVGWSANLGSSWSTVEGELASSAWNANGYYGETGVGSLTPYTSAGAGDPALFTAAFPNGSMVLYAVPEPTTLALAGLGGMALLAFRRRKVS